MSRVVPAWAIVIAALLALPAPGCRSAAPAAAGASGTLLLIGGGLDDDNRPVFGRFLALAAANGPPRIVIATAASGDQDDMARGKVAALRTWDPEVPCDVVRRETPTAATVAAIDAATAMFFTGGDQARVTDRYRPGDADTPEWLAMRRLLQRGGVIAGSSAGLAMMGDVMFLSGRSAPALGVPAAASEGEAPAGPQFGPGMRFLPWLLTDSHFFERDRLGRLVAGLEAARIRLGLGVGEDACVEVDLGAGTITGIGVPDSLLVDAAHLRRDGLSRRGLVAVLVRQGDRISLRDRLDRPPEPPPPPPPMQPVLEEIAEEGQNRQLASWRVFARASLADSGLWHLPLDGWRIAVWPAGGGEVAFDVNVDSAPR
jgi:cyanophycinase